MASRITAALLAAALTSQVLTGSALAENAMGYRLLNASDAAALPRGGGRLGMNVGRAQQISDSGMTFEILHVDSVQRGSAGQRAGFKAGDEIIAVDGHVFPSVAAFGAYVGSKSPGSQIAVDYIPSGGGPQQAQRLGVTLNGAGGTAAQPNSPPASGGLSTGAKVAIGVGAAALFGCYKLGCFKHRAPAGT